MVLLAGGNGSGGYLASSEIYNPSTGAFSTTGSLNTARQSHTAALLDNGTVLIAGGTNGGYLAAAELYSPATQNFSATGSLATSRYMHTASLLNNGLVLIAGGNTHTGGVLTSAELYNPATNTFSSTGSLSAARENQTATKLANGKVLVAAGVGNGYLKSAEIYDPSAGTFSATGSLHTGRNGHTATLLGSGTVLIAGGYGDVVVGQNSYQQSAELYSPTTGTFSGTGLMHTARAYYAASILPAGLVLVAGGSNSAGYVGGAELYNPSTGTFSATGSLNTARQYCTATLLNTGQVLIVGGFGSSGFVASAELYNPSTGTFSVTGSLNVPRELHAATLLSNGLVLITGGDGAGGVLSSTELYNPSSGTFILTGSLATVRYQHTATLLANGTVLVAGGFNSTSYTLSSAELYEPNATFPEITTLSSTSGGVGTQITITGTLFGPPQATSEVLFNGTLATTTSWTPTSIVALVPTGATPGNVVVVTDSVPSNGVNFTPGPSVLSLSSQSAAVGNPITLNGVNFGSTQGSSIVKFNGTSATAISSWSNSSIKTTVPIGATTGPVVVTVVGLASNGLIFTVSSVTSGGPMPPSNLSATVVSGSQINLSWTASSTSGVTYKVLRNAVQIASGLSSTAYSDSGLTAGTTYTYQVEAVNSQGTSAPSNAASATSSPPVPQPPSNLTAIPLSPTDIELNWAPSPSPNITYTVINASTQQPLTILLRSTSYTVSGLAASTQYCYYVEAVSDASMFVVSSPSNTACAITFAGNNCTASDASTINEGPDSSNNILYELKAHVTSQNNNSATYDEGAWWAYGINATDYIDCSGSSQPGEQDEGNELLDLDVPQVSGQAGFMWWLDEWVLELEGCFDDDPNPDGVEEIGTDYPYPTPVFYVPCP